MMDQEDHQVSQESLDSNKISEHQVYPGSRVFPEQQLHPGSRVFLETLRIRQRLNPTRLSELKKQQTY